MSIGCFSFLPCQKSVHLVHVASIKAHLFGCCSLMKQILSLHILSLHACPLATALVWEPLASGNWVTCQIQNVTCSRRTTLSKRVLFWSWLKSKSFCPDMRCTWADYGGSRLGGSAQRNPSSRPGLGCPLPLTVQLQGVFSSWDGDGLCCAGRPAGKKNTTYQSGTD